MEALCADSLCMLSLEYKIYIFNNLFIDFNEIDEINNYLNDIEQKLSENKLSDININDLLNKIKNINREYKYLKNKITDYKKSYELSLAKCQNNGNNLIKCFEEYYNLNYNKYDRCTWLLEDYKTAQKNSLISRQKYKKSYNNYIILLIYVNVWHLILDKSEELYKKLQLDEVSKDAKEKINSIENYNTVPTISDDFIKKICELENKKLENNNIILENVKIITLNNKDESNTFIEQITNC